MGLVAFHRFLQINQGIHQQEKVTMQLLFNKTWRYYFPLIVWSVVIFIFSAMPGSGEQGYDLWFFLERKGAHIFEYAVLAIFWVRVFWIYHKDEENHCYFWGIFASFVYAISDEIHQIFVIGRSGKPSDVLIDLLGILLGTAIYWSVVRYRKKKVI